jgi:hypothetical protein
VKKFRVFLAGLMTATLIPFNAAFAAEKTADLYIAEDVDPESIPFAYEEIDDFMSADIIDGKVDEEGYVYVKPYDNITRAQFVKMLVNALNLEGKGTAKTFADVKASDWFAPYVEVASSLGIVNGNNGKFNPYEKIKRNHMAAFIHRAVKADITFNPIGKTFTDVPNDEFYTAIHEAAANGIINGYGDTFKPYAFATRAQGILMIHRAMGQQKSDLPNEEELESFLRSHILAENKAAEAMNTAELTKLYNSNTTGYYRAMGLDSLTMYQDMFGDEEMTLKADEEFNVDTLSMSNHYAKLEITDIQYYIEMKFGTDTFTMDMDMSGEYSLKKMKDGQWKIYNFIPYDEDLEDMPFLAVSH